MKLSTEKIQNLPYVRIGKKSQVFFLFFLFEHLARHPMSDYKVPTFLNGIGKVKV